MPTWLPIRMTKVKPFKFQIHFQPVYGLWLSIFLLSFILQLGGWVNAWRYDRSLVEQGEWWLLLTAHLVHLNWSHWALNMAGLGIVAFFFSAYASVKQWLLVMLVSAIFIGVGVSWLDPDIEYYLGLSGVLHGLFIFGALREIRYYPVSGYVLLLLLIAKLTWEFFMGPLPGSEEFTGGRVLTDAHLYGAIGGATVWFGDWLVSAYVPVAGR